MFQQKPDKSSIRKDKSVNIKSILLGPRADEGPDHTSLSLSPQSLGCCELDL